MRLGEESTQQIILFDWIRHIGLDDIAFHVGNERKTTMQGGAILKRMGVKAGVSDVLLLRSNGRYHGLIIEMKANGGKLSLHQAKFLETMAKEGYLTKVCFSASDAIKTIQSYLNMSST